MTGRKIMNYALALCYELPNSDVLTRNLTVPLLNLGIAELTSAENAFRANQINNTSVVELLTEPVAIEKPEDDVPYNYNITTILLPLWLAWHVLEGLEEAKATEYHALYETRKSELVPAVWKDMEDHNGFDCWGAFWI